MIKSINTKDLQLLMAGSDEYLLLDVLPPEYYEEKHILGAMNAPVYEVAFLDNVSKLTTNKNINIVVYNDSPHSLASMDAAIKLEKAGYQNIYEFNGGLSEWEKSGLAVEVGEPVSYLKIENGKYMAINEASRVSWQGRNIGRAHSGEIGINVAELEIKDMTPKSLWVELSMASLKSLDQEDSMMREWLDSHLKSVDFFEVEKYPVASFKTRSITVFRELGPQKAKYTVVGDLTIKDVTKEISLEALLSKNTDGQIKAQAHFDFDRTQWHVFYGSGKFYEKLGSHLVSDIVSVEVFLSF